jgi:hypothetical protein
MPVDRGGWVDAEAEDDQWVHISSYFFHDLRAHIPANSPDARMHIHRPELPCFRSLCGDGFCFSVGTRH